MQQWLCVWRLGVMTTSMLLETMQPTLRCRVHAWREPRGRVGLLGGLKGTKPCKKPQAPPEHVTTVPPSWVWPCIILAYFSLLRLHRKPTLLRWFSLARWRLHGKGFSTQSCTFNDVNFAHIVQCGHSNILSKPWRKLVPKVQHFTLLPGLIPLAQQ